MGTPIGTKEIQLQASGKGLTGTPSAMSGEEERKIKDELFEASMAGKWPKVEQLYRDNKFTHDAKLTKSEDTVLHLAIASYRPDKYDSIKDPHLECIQNMVKGIPREKKQYILKQKNDKGNTPLHLAAELGSIPIIESLLPINSTQEEQKLTRETNLIGETPLFITAYRGHLQAFLYLHNQNEKGEGRLELCRRGNGDNILHAAISGEYFKLAFQIIHHYEPLVNRYNQEGMSPLHFLSRMPQVFKSGSHFRATDSIIYYCINVEKLKEMTYKPEEKEDLDYKLNWDLPENYQTMVDFLELLWKWIRKTLVYTGILNGNQENKSPGRQKDPESLSIQAEGKTKDKLFPANYTIFINFLKCLMKIVLVVLGIGLERIQKLEEKKKHHTWAVQIMEKMIEKEQRYKFYENTGERPENMDLDTKIAPPPLPPQTKDGKTEEDDDDIDAPLMESPTSTTDTKKINDLKSESSKNKVTPLLVASKMGIVEMVHMILKKFPIAIQDADSDEKNILLLAVEHRQTMVYNWLIGEKFPEHVFYQVDRQGNNAVHLAANFQGHELWRIPGAALQLQGERKWYKYVKYTLPPQTYVRYNNKGQTPGEIYRVTHAKLLETGTVWLVTTANSFSVVAALIATVAFATSSTIPGGADDHGRPHLEDQPAFKVFSITSLVSLCFSVTALVFFLAILTSRCQHSDFERELPKKLLLGLTSLFASISSVLVSFCAAHFFVLQDRFRNAAFPIYAATCVPVVFFAFNQFPLYVDLIRSYIKRLPLRSYKVFYTDSSPGESSSNQEKDGKEKAA